MSRERSPHREKAFKLWCEGMRVRKLSSIAKELGVAAELIRKWKFLDNWDERPEPGPKRRGAPKGSKNALGNKGGGAPRKNDNAIKHGGYATIWEDVLDPEEQVKLMFVETDPLKQVENLIRFFELRERRMLQLRSKIMDGWDADEEKRTQQLVKEETTEFTIIDEDGNVSHMEIKQPAFREVEKVSRTPQKLERVLAIEDALTRVQDKKLKCIDLLYKLEARQLSEEEARMRIEKLQRENKILAAKEW